MRTICVFCGSNQGQNEAYSQAAVDLANILVARNIQLVYGAGSIGLMGIVADHVLNRGGRVVGVIPGFLATREVMHANLSKTHIVDSLLERKFLMMALADGFIALPGGLGTIDELMEVYSWAQLGRHNKPIGLLNASGYFDPFLHMIDHSVDEGFTRKEHRQVLIAETDAEILLHRMMQ